MRPGGFEPPTNSLEGCCSIHLSYGRRNDLRNSATLNVCRTYGKHLPAGLQGQPLGRVLHHLRSVTHRAKVSVNTPHESVAECPSSFPTVYGETGASPSNVCNRAAQYAYGGNKDTFSSGVRWLRAHKYVRQDEERGTWSLNQFTVEQARAA